MQRPQLLSFLHLQLSAHNLGKEANAIVVKSLFGLIRRSFFKSVHCTTDQGSSLGPSFMNGNMKKSYEIPHARTFFAKKSFSKHSIKCLASDEISVSFSRSQNEMFL
jgi:hypothetical protein